LVGWSVGLRSFIFLLGRGEIIKSQKFFLLLIVCSLLFSNAIFVFSADKTKDTKDKDPVVDESAYFGKVKSVMDKEKKDQASSEENKDKQDKKKKISIGYFSYIKIIIVLAIVIGLIYGITYFIRKSLKITDKAGEGATIVLSQPLGPGKWIQVVFVAGKYLVLGVTNDHINLISEVTDKKEIERFEVLMNERKTEEGHSFMDVVTDFFKNTLKKKVTKESFDYEKDSLGFLKKQKERLDKLNGKNKE
jgi:flagellar protein FliO/FliZ